MKLLNIFKKDRGKETKETLKDNKDPKLYPSTGYSYTPSFARANNQFATITKLTNHYGQNRNQTYGWFVNILPEINVDDVKGYFIEVSKPLTDADQKKVMSKSPSTLEALDEDNQPIKGNHGQREINELHKYDITQANKYHRRQDKMIDSKKHLLLVSKNPDNISEQLKALNDYYHEDHAGLKLESDAGDQENLFKELLTPPSGNIYEETMMSTEYAGFDHAVRRGLNDEKGVAIGELTASLTNGSAMMDLNGSFKNKILVSATKSSHIYEFDKKLSAASMWGQKVANHAMAYGSKTFHIVLNDFNYYGEANIPGKTKTFSAEPIMNSVLKKIDLSKGGLNPLQLFGDPKDQVQVYHSHLDKLVYQFYLYTNRTMNQKMIPNLRKELNNFYETKGIWNNKAEKYPGRIRILGKRADSYPTFDQFLLVLTNYADETAIAGSHKVQDAEDMVTSLETVLDTHYSTINTYTTLPDPDDPDIYQYYYQLSKLDGDIKESQFLNVFDYIAFAAQKNDIIMIHGVDQLSTETASYIKRTLEKIEKNGIRTAYLFDIIGRKQLNDNTKSKSEGINNIEYCDIFNTNGILYEDIENEFDYTILGTMSKNDLKKYEFLIKQTLPAELQNIMTATKEKDQFQVRRPEDLTSNFVWGNFVL